MKLDKAKLKIIIISAASVLILTIVIIVAACLNAAKDKEIPPSSDSDSVDVFAEQDEASNEAEESGETFTFESNGDGSCTLIKVNDKAVKDITVPEKSPSGDKVTKIAKSAFEGCTELKTVTISAGIAKIEEGAFISCPSLTAFVVSTSNNNYTAVSGVLFSKDKTILVCYPASRAGKSYLLSTRVKFISAYAFDSVTSLSTILYESGSAKYKEISIGEGNQAFTSLTVKYNYVAAK